MCILIYSKREKTNHAKEHTILAYSKYHQAHTAIISERKC